ncbi:hypothetical protein EDD21DRAFT_440773 [Dissophora ornata]|nr:hypothetical protein EDD21DRAFT_440773 [Dissophora ornata]
MKIFLAITTALMLASTVAASFSSCASSSSAMQFYHATFTRNPPAPGQDMCVTIVGRLSKPITAGATLHVTASFLGFKVYDAMLDLCDALAGGPTSCPIPTTATIMTQCLKVPSGVPQGVWINLRAVARSKDGNEYFCFQGPLKIGP